MATSSILSGASNTGAALNGSADVSGLTLSDANFSTAVTDGSVTVNGAIVNIASTDTLQDVFDNINTATGGAVTGSYNPATDKVELSSASEIVLVLPTRVIFYRSRDFTITAAVPLRAIPPLGQLS